MKESKMKFKSVLQERVNILKTKGYRGFRLSGEGPREQRNEVGARSRTGLMLIAIGNTLDEAYVNLVKRIDQTLDG